MGARDIAAIERRDRTTSARFLALWRRRAALSVEESVELEALLHERQLAALQRKVAHALHDAAYHDQMAQLARERADQAEAELAHFEGGEE